jgi:hypothetical protein
MMNISNAGNNQTIRLAAEELAKYLGRMLGSEIAVDIRLGLMSEFAEIVAPEVADPELDDAIYMNVVDGKCVIVGINPRSVLIGVYRFLSVLGCRWVRPGADGEYIPSLDEIPRVCLEETPSYRHRGITIEGAVSYEHVRDMIDWLPKVGFNGYFTQFREAFEFFDRWYSHQSNPLLEGHPITTEQAREYLAQAVVEIKKRGLLYHAVGHGWTCEPFGIEGLGWRRVDEVPETARQYLAEVNGKREYWGGVPLNTNLCYGNPEVRRIIVEEIADYSAEHPEIDYMHFWLADGVNNHCECELCQDSRPADLYVTMLNELDDALTSRGLDTRIVFLIYVDLLWPPEREKIRNQDRFVLMFAPITRTYSESYADLGPLPELPPFTRNKLEFPRSVAMNVAFLRAWQEWFKGDSFDFDYHLTWDHYNDPGYMQVAETINKDMRGLKEIGIDGMVSCQMQRTFFPTGLPMLTMGWTLWDGDLPFEEVVDEYFDAAFGPDADEAREYLETMTRLFDPVYMRDEANAVSETAAANLARVPEAVDRIRPVIERNLGTENECWAKSWFYLKHSTEICRLLAEAYGARARGDKASAHEAWERTKQYVQAKEMELHPVLDVLFFVNTQDGRFPA